MPRWWRKLRRRRSRRRQANGSREAVALFEIDDRGASADNNMEHELVVLRTDLADGALPVSKGRVLEHKLRKIGEIEDIAPGKSKRATFKLAPGPDTMKRECTALVVAP